ncbi:proline-rich protein 5-like [Triplophysa dalaica]|uniref:proline-rich protein 5-like n=1 Tax=Triplophysa dalaica TaxID=1582913 RepID=UPI0024DFF342|nr:proline-rich protein 5-like [Triplophysa dalaica]
MGSFRRPRPRFMSSPVLSDLAHFHASSPALQLSNASVWNSVQTAVIKVFQGGSLHTNELYTLNESIRWLLRTELGSFITEYFQDQLLNKGLTNILEKIRLQDDETLLHALCETWVRFFTEILPTLQAIFYPVQGQELTVRQMALLGFRNMVLLKLPVENMLHDATYPPPITQMLLILQGIHEPNGPTQEYFLLEKLVDMVISPYLGNYLYLSRSESSSGGCSFFYLVNSLFFNARCSYH